MKKLFWIPLAIFCVGLLTFGSTPVSAQVNTSCSPGVLCEVNEGGYISPYVTSGDFNGSLSTRGHLFEHTYPGGTYCDIYRNASSNAYFYGALTEAEYVSFRNAVIANAVPGVTRHPCDVCGDFFCEGGAVEGCGDPGQNTGLNSRGIPACNHDCPGPCPPICGDGYCPPPGVTFGNAEERCSETNQMPNGPRCNLDCLSCACTSPYFNFDGLQCPGLCGTCPGCDPCCGNNNQEAGEQCDGTDVPSNCIALGYCGGSLSCSSGCLFNTSLCSTVGCSATTLSNCNVSAVGDGGSSGTCSFGGACSYTCDCGTWNFNSNSCAPPPGPCSGTTINGCALTGTAHLSTEVGTCSGGGGCSYSCNNGSWTQVTNTCTGPTCTGAAPSNATACPGENPPAVTTANSLAGDGVGVCTGLPDCEHYCPAGFTQSGGNCVAAACAVNGTCDPGETFANCPADCPPPCGSQSYTTANGCGTVTLPVESGSTRPLVYSTACPGGCSGAASASCNAAGSWTGQTNNCAPLACATTSCKNRLPTAAFTSCNTMPQFTCPSVTSVCWGAWPEPGCEILDGESDICSAASNNSSGKCNSIPWCRWGQCNCTAQTVNSCTLPATNDGQSTAGTCGGGACNYTCNNGAWSENSNTCVAGGDCLADTNGSSGYQCTVGPISDGGSSAGSCAENGTCSATCNSTVLSWTNNCVPAPVPVNGVCNTGAPYGCTSGTSNPGAYANTPTEWRWRCDQINGGSNSGQCSMACLTENYWQEISSVRLGSDPGSTCPNVFNPCSSVGSTCTEVDLDEEACPFPMDPDDCPITEYIEYTFECQSLGCPAPTDCTSSSTNGSGATQCISAASGTNGQTNVPGTCAQSGTCDADCNTGSWTNFTNNCVAGLCAGGAGTDDTACGQIDCDGLDNYTQSGTESATATETCTYNNYADLTSNRCEGVNNCKDPNTPDCGSPATSPAYTCGTCRFINAATCNGGSTPGTCSNYPNGTACGGGNTCDGSGNCIAPPATCTLSAIASTPHPDAFICTNGYNFGVSNGIIDCPAGAFTGQVIAQSSINNQVFCFEPPHACGTFPYQYFVRSCGGGSNCTSSSTNGSGATQCTSASSSANGQTNVPGTCAQNGTCDADCNNGSWTNFTNNCVAARFNCTGTTASNATLCSGDNTGLTADTPRTTVGSCTAGTKCEYTCNTGYRDGGANTCTLNVCTGSVAANATLCSGDSTNIPGSSNVARTTVGSCTAGTKCEYTCNSGYVDGGANVCNAAPVSWVRTCTWTSQPYPTPPIQNCTNTGPICNSGNITAPPSGACTGGQVCDQIDSWCAVPCAFPIPLYSNWSCQ